MEVKLLRLFGFEVNTYIKGDKRLNGFEEGNQSGMSCEVGNENEKSLTIASSGTVSTAKGKSSEHEFEQKKYRCQFCQREFKNPQAMGGHQNAHKREKLKRRKMQLHAKGSSSNSYLVSPQSQNTLFHHDSSSWSYPSDEPKFTCYGECLISFNPPHEKQKLHYAYASKSIAMAPQNCKPDAPSRSVVINPSASYVSKDCENPYIQLGLSQK